jgi:hypothetical protein
VGVIFFGLIFVWKIDFLIGVGKWAVPFGRCLKAVIQEVCERMLEEPRKILEL